MNLPYDILLPGVPASSQRGALGWCNVVLFRIGGATILFDTGSYGDRQGLLQALAARGLKPGDVSFIFASHFHYDHILNVELFQCPIFLSAAERSYVDSKQYLEAGDPFVPHHLMAFVASRVQTVSDGQELLPGVKVLLLPGHTPGTTGLLLENEGVVLAGDSVKNAWDFVRNAPPPAFFSTQTAPANYARLRGLADTIVPGHDLPFRIGQDGSVTSIGRHAAVIEAYPDPAGAPRRIPLGGE
ncbi:MAG: MBL fold metallo-hydrolase [Holophaga sp.]|nr:MBL fold metallo-hydrolase [Holophaga sp.]